MASASPPSSWPGTGAGGLHHRQPPKWDTLRALGFDDDHIGDSRTLDFEQKFLDGHRRPRLRRRARLAGRRLRRRVAAAAAPRRLVPRDGQDRHPRRRHRRRRPPRRPLPRLRPLRTRSPADARVHRRAVRDVRSGHPDAASGHHVGHPPRARRAAAPEPGPPHRQDRHDDARRVDPRHRADHRRHRHGRRRGRPPRRRQARCAAPAAAVAPRTRRPRRRRAGRRADRRGRRRPGASPPTPPTAPQLQAVARRRRGQPLSAVVHAAGVLDDAVDRLADARARRPGAARQGRRRVEPARADPRRESRCLRDVLVDGRCRRLGRAGQLLRRQHLPRRPRRAPARARAARDLAGVGSVGAGQRHDRSPRRGRPVPAGPRRHPRDVDRRRDGAVRLGARGRRAAAGARPDRPRRAAHPVRRRACCRRCSRQLASTLDPPPRRRLAGRREVEVGSGATPARSVRARAAGA